MNYISKFVAFLAGLLGFNVAMPSTGPPLIGVLDGPMPNSPPHVPFDSKRWALANPWLLEGQADDRPPMDGSVTDNWGPPSEQRSFARRSHQLMFKKWSQDRHD